jgi:Fic family protein
MAERIPWKPIARLDVSQIPANGALASLDALRAEWERFLSLLPDEQQKAIRQRSLRRLAIETGILERLYDIDWGLTLTLIAEGFTREAIERGGGQVDDRTRATLEAQRDSLGMVLEFVAMGRELTPGFIKELHAAITRTQATYVVTDALGRITEAPLVHGDWKIQPNHVELGDGRILEYAPPEQVSIEVDRLVESHLENERLRVHPIVAAAWLHHRFVQIHPFADGNGRVARALVLLVMQKHRYAPLVVDRFHREAYLTALGAANDGDLSPLIKLFVRLESSALAGELESPESETARGVSSEVAQTLAAQLQELRRRHKTHIQQQLKVRSLSIAARIRSWFESKENELRETFRQHELEDAHVWSDTEIGENASRWFWFRHQIATAARRAGHFADLSPGSGWCGLRIRLGEIQLRYVAALHGVGHDAGVLAVVTFGELETTEIEEDGGRRADRQLIETSTDSFRVVHSEPLAALDERANELEDLLDEGLTIALVEIFRIAH